ncbi:transforming acidic coiled-coil-containing protein 3 isoform X1 [Falco biarmicus]|uniref:transforming acidic coiled-coil-containing protein 3 isoform X1 n=2 Tax=Falco cherrug TaxID=345164 RepID=UPI002478C33D|nr:transforming acidic coiled-coil-containing protein 3 isoform X1 [Falco cherrug]XP_055569412.1 transforming acidic coiled-coil-containing protein 3 isoform X1 [Falco cherrug]XP_056199989.1 transforming acidic coiled-coil-containing protein 3 isoform X1 [Falco biarmicus]XP_056199997.1 transforming acidic coiled-coil-containing protein 3 isoform X1 [Falco biarmicus]
MSLQILNAENGENGANVKDDLTAEDSGFFFAPEPTGRPSILCLSQKENLPRKSVAKAMKVTFQTPLRDPQTRKILSPAMVDKLDTTFMLGDCSEALVDDLLSVPVNVDTCQQKPETGPNNTVINTQMPEKVSTAPYPDDEMPVKSRGSYNIDFDNLNDINPFQSAVQLQHSPGNLQKSPVRVSSSPERTSEISSDSVLLDDTAPFASTTASRDCPSEEKTLSSGKESVLRESESNKSELSLKQGIGDSVRDVKSASTGVSQIDDSAGLEETSTPAVQLSGNLGPSDTAKTGESKLQNVSVAEKASVDELAVSEGEPAEKPGVTKAGPVKLEFDFDNTTVRKPPLKKLGKRLGIKPPSKKIPVTKTKTEKTEVQNKGHVEGEIPVPKASYKFDWDKLDDPNFNPFGGGSKISSSPKCSSPQKAHLPDEEKDSISSRREPPSVEQDNRPSTCEKESKNLEISKQNVVEDKPRTQEDKPGVQAEAELPGEIAMEKQMSPSTMSLANVLSQDNLVSADSGKKSMSAEEIKPSSHRTEIAAVEQTANTKPEELFRPSSEVLGMGIEIDYLEQFGTSSFKESALRKQSLYLKFDPLLRDSPIPGTVETNTNIMTAPLQRGPVADLSKLLKETENPAVNLQSEDKPKGLDLLGTFTTSDTGPVIIDSLTSDVPPLPIAASANSAVDAIIDVLKYSQKDMDAAVELVQREVQKKELETQEWKKKYDKLHMEYKEMGKIVAEFEGTITQMMEDAQKQKESSKKEMQRMMEEKQQVISDLNSMEKSFSELFKRFEKQKEALEGYHKNEEALKKCAEEYLARIKKEEQRYQALKAHAEEKLHRANEEIAQVRSKAKSETAALQASLRKEQMRIQSLERSLEQKAKENDELTKICDDLILKMEKI